MLVTPRRWQIIVCEFFVIDERFLFDLAYTYATQIRVVHCILLNPAAQQSLGCWFVANLTCCSNNQCPMLRTNPYFTTTTYQQAIQEPFCSVLVMLINELAREMLLALSINTLVNTDSFYMHSVPLPRCCYQGIDDAYKRKFVTTEESGCCVWFVCTSILLESS